MLPRHPHPLGQMRERKRGCPALEAILAILPSNAVEDDRRELVECGRKVGFSNVAQNGAGGQVRGRFEVGLVVHLLMAIGAFIVAPFDKD
jgi:hypothetical protein